MVLSLKRRYKEQKNKRANVCNYSTVHYVTLTRISVPRGTQWAHCLDQVEPFTCGQQPEKGS